MRFVQFIPFLKSKGIECEVSPLFNDSMLQLKYRHGSYGTKGVLSAYWRRVCVMLGAHRFDVLWIEKEALPWFPAWFEKRLLCRVPYVLDFDDAIFHNYDLHRFGLVRSLLGKKINWLMASSRLVVAGNHYLANRATGAGAKWVEIIPTVIDLSRYPMKKGYALASVPIIVWIGSPSTAQYLLDLAEPLAKLAKQTPFLLRVIGGGQFVMPGVNVEVRAWSLETEVANILECDVGVMPLRDTPWEQGKCAYKLIQYMACGLPTVSSPIGANKDVVLEGQSGFHADSPRAWFEALADLLSDESLRKQMGQAGRMRVEVEYSLQIASSKLYSLLEKAGH